MVKYIKYFISALGTFGVYLFGSLDIALQTLLIFILFDYLTGILKSYKSKTLNSNKGIKGIKKKVGILLLVSISCFIDRLIGDSGLIRTSVIYYLVANEGLSIIENLGEMDILIPEFLKDKLEQLKNKDAKND